MSLPTLFISHGAPNIILEQNSTTDFWRSLSGMMPMKPRALLCVSAHWDMPEFSISGTQGAIGIQHDFYGFPKALYEINWREHEDKQTAAWLLKRLAELKVDVVETARPLDHGVWVPLKTAWPEVDFPVYQLSLSLAHGLDNLWQMGQRLQALRDEGVLLVGSGGITHNLRALDWQAAEGEAVPWAAAFVAAVDEAIAMHDREKLCKPWQLPYGNECHPTLEHYAPLLFTLGAANGEQTIALHRAWMYGTFALHAYGAGF